MRSWNNATNGTENIVRSSRANLLHKAHAMRKSLRATSKPIHNERNDGATLPYQHASKVMLGHDSKVKQVVVSIVLHEMAMAHGAIMALARAACLHLTIIMERGHATDNIYDLAVLLV